ncbi:bifunctional chorismate mutase/prephenate dehydrogenase [Pseudofrancisella aestuarii]|uniref:Bifunctional chorismate mutase/prephenate dehydrogenase n=1 Tax=Pseudofrancisella aestuarii TaxID=2670347 RepID=A0ABV9TBZ5_9GAMM|nr:bifunctional chorismate mutase/prephenate dehydrogenase [Pseudofrancisella aestuarii]
MSKKICIVGGNGEMGQMTQKLFSMYFPDYEVTIFGSKDWANPQPKLENKDLVIISVPIYLTKEIIDRVVPFLSEGCVLADYTSIKQEPLEAMLSAYQGPVVGLHPIFGPTVEIPDKQVITVCDGRNEEKYKWLLDDLESIGFSIEHMSAKDHDDIMTFVQGIEHFSVYCLGLFLKKKNIDIDRVLKLASPVYKMELNIVGRLFSQGPGLYADIIMSDDSRKEMVAEFAEFVQQNAKGVEKGDKATFIENFKQVKSWMGDFADKAYKESDKLLLKK